MDHQAPPLAKQLLKSNAAGEERISFLQGCRSWKTIHALVDSPTTSVHMQAALSWFNGERKGLHKEDGKGGVEEVLEEIEWGYMFDQIDYMHVWNSQTAIKGSFLVFILAHDWLACSFRPMIRQHFMVGVHGRATLTLSWGSKRQRKWLRFYPVLWEDAPKRCWSRPLRGHSIYKG